MRNVKLNHKTILTICLFKQRNKGENCCSNSLKSSIYLLGDEPAKHVNLMHPMLVSNSSCYFSSLEGGIRKVSEKITLESSLSWFSSYINL